MVKTKAAQTKPAQTYQKNRQWSLIKRYRFIYFMIAPILLYFLVFSCYPLILGIIQSFYGNRLLGRPKPVGLQNYLVVTSDRLFWQAFQNSVLIGVGSLLLTLFLSVLLTLLINELRCKFLRGGLQTVSFLPYLFSWTVIGGIWIFIFSNSGLLNGLLRVFGWNAVNFLSISDYAQPLFIFTAAWKNTGYYIILLMASLVSVDPVLYEAARIDGAGRLQQMRHIMLPALKNTVITLVILGVTGLLRNFDQAFVMGNAAIMEKTRTLLLYIYNKGIVEFKVGTATAAATLVLAATLGLTWLAKKLSGRSGQELF